MVEGLTSSATDQGSVAEVAIDPSRLEIEDHNIGAPARQSCGGPLPVHIQTQKILVTLAERPHPFPSRTRKLSSPAPKILRGQPFGKIGRRQDFCVSGACSGERRRGPSVAGRTTRAMRAREPVPSERWPWLLPPSLCYVCPGDEAGGKVTSDNIRTSLAIVKHITCAR